jgi:hypothetical protein
MAGTRRPRNPNGIHEIPTVEILLELGRRRMSVLGHSGAT